VLRRRLAKPGAVLTSEARKGAACSLDQPGGDHPGYDEGEYEPVGEPGVHLAELGAVAAAAVAAGIHSGGQNVGAGEASYKDRDEQAPQAPRARYGAALIEGDAAGGLGAGEALDFLDEYRDELDRDDEDEDKLVDRDSEPLQRADSINMVVT
jgi:hypothetical protein